MMQNYNFIGYQNENLINKISGLSLLRKWNIISFQSPYFPGNIEVN